jgi:hypothetical protein
MEAVTNTTKNMVLKHVFIAATYLWKNYECISGGFKT